VAAVEFLLSRRSARLDPDPKLRRDRLGVLCARSKHQSRGRAAQRCIALSVDPVSIFSGGISNTGKITGRTGIDLADITTFAGNIVNTGTTTGGGTGVAISAATISGSIIDSGTIVGGLKGIIISGADVVSGRIRVASAAARSSPPAPPAWP
jgi:hypothetical protein